MVEFFTGFKPQEKGSREWRVKKKRGKLRESRREGLRQKMKKAENND